MKRTAVLIGALLSVPVGTLLMMNRSVASPTPIPMAQPQTGCHVLLMEGECRQYLSLINGAATSTERELIRDSYTRLVREREKLCRCGPETPSLEKVSAPKAVPAATLARRTRI